MFMHKVALLAALVASAHAASTTVTAANFDEVILNGGKNSIGMLASSFPTQKTCAFNQKKTRECVIFTKG
jgi:hypothetical protein